MPNNGKISYCPYYIAEHQKTITCEDTIRRFSSVKNKTDWQKSYCHRKKEWIRCPYAKAIDDLYKRTDSMSSSQGMIEYLTFCNESKMAEFNKLLSILGTAEKKARKNNGNKA